MADGFNLMLFCSQYRTVLQQSDLADLNNLGPGSVYRGTLAAPCGNPPLEHHMTRPFLKFCRDESGATAIEYGLIAAGIALAIIAAVNGLGSNLNTMFTSINTSLK
jgi:pilus assembly protein Flp/PilA